MQDPFTFEALVRPHDQAGSDQPDTRPRGAVRHRARTPGNDQPLETNPKNDTDLAVATDT
ncbi:hypothetical protein [Streptomyces sp. WAC 04229]|uniref:hypothetical protein n=1 Tax=Streptomyces sp. WAC 04229 TaxID=2203206 RepID=UPI00163D262C|nr:hypothetical protein [Streptomyces sp. WAC 04229]